VEGVPTVKGQFPSNYLSAPLGGGAGGEGQSASCVYEYVAAQEGDLTMQVGDIVIVTDTSGGDWWTGYVDTQPDYPGQFPATYVELAP